MNPAIVELIEKPSIYKIKMCEGKTTKVCVKGPEKDISVSRIPSYYIQMYFE